MKKVRTRYAPSPTGYLHIGGARTALFCYLFAKHNNGDFIIRIEDTDIKRNVENGEKSQIENLEWMGVIADESPLKSIDKYAPYRQSERLDIYNKYAQQLIEKDQAYYCFDTEEELIQQKEEQKQKRVFSFRYDSNWLNLSDEEKAKRIKNQEYTIRLRFPENVTYNWKDLVRGEISFNSDEIGDYVIVKGDGYPTYNFACVIDDHLMDITHVFRGEEHISNTPKQIAIYKMFGWDVPEFGHFTIITNMEGKKLSKRDLTLKQFIEDYKNEGYMSEGMVNFLALLGWSPTHTNEMMNMKQIIKEFDIHHMSKSPSKFDIQKLQWFSNQYFKQLSFDKLEKRLMPYIKDEVKTHHHDWVKALLEIYQPQIYAASQIKELITPFVEEIQLTDEMKKFLNTEISQKVLKTFLQIISEKTFTLENITLAIQETKKQTSENGKNLFMPLRIAIVHVEHGPELNKSIFLLGKEKIKERLSKVLSN